eukprot:30905_1
MTFTPWCRSYVHHKNNMYQITKITIKTSTKRYLDNYAATNRIQSLLKKNDKHTISATKKNDIVDQAFNIYHQTTEIPNHFLINTLLKTLYQLGHSDKISLLWHDIQQNNNNCALSFPLLMKCCISADTVTISQCIQVLDSIKHCQYKLRLHGYFINKLISKCNTNVNALHYVHACIDAGVIIDNNPVITKTVFIAAYSQVHHMDQAWTVFDSISNAEKDSVVIGAMMKALLNNECYTQTLTLYDTCDNDNKCNDVIHMLAIKACTKLLNKDKGYQIIHKMHINYSKTTNALLNVLIDFYGKCGDMDNVQRVFEHVQRANKMDVFVINSMLKAHLHNNETEQVLQLYDGMDTYPIQKDTVSHLLAIKACNKSHNLCKGQHIYNSLQSQSCGTSLTIHNAMIDLYGTCGEIQRAESVFFSIQESDKDIVSISAIMNAYCSNELYHKAIHVFNTMHVQPDMVCYATAVKACCNGDFFDIGHDIWLKLQSDPVNRWMLREIDLQIPFITLFGRNGWIEKCESILNDIKTHKPNECNNEINLWNAMIAAYVKNANMDKAMQMYDEMKTQTGLKGDVFTFSALLSGHSHCGNVDAAYRIWNNEINEECMRYDQVIVASLVDVLSRKGEVYQALNIIEEYESYGDNKPYHVMWSALLSGVVMHKHTLTQHVQNEYRTRWP